ncbi:MAG TPA: asparagine synthase (glutamine-hydrolyzing) [Candidatus Angelobacter sp.]|nr:asparagine synthase (glutamine-hydrolyzing) [Candidatus Angelobacter sp.]
MCGIAGFWSTKTFDVHPVEVLNRMGQTLTHRGPDDSGVFYENGSGLGLSFRRLSIIDLSAEGHQPMASASGRFIIIFNGEVYNFEEIRAELGTHAWRGHSDTEVMLAAIERWGLEAAVKRFVGMFALALWDRDERRLHLVRDRIGIKPLYYGHVDGSFVFASELKAIRAFPGFQGAIDRDTLAAYMRLGHVPAPYSIYEGMHQLQPGHILTLTGAEVSPQLTPFWSAAEVARRGVQSRGKGSDEELLEQLHQKLLEAVRMRMIADVPLGAFLSGGIDSSIVVALMQAQSARPVRTFTIGFHEGVYDEAIYARKVAAHLGTDHTELLVTPKDALDVVPLLPAMYDEPFADSSQIPTHLVSKLARRDVTVALSGDGGDELFCGYSRYTFLNSLWNGLKRIPAPAAKATARMIHSIPPSAFDRSAGWLPLPPRLRNSPGHKIHRLADHLVARDPGEICLRTISLWPDPAVVVPQAREHDVVPQAIERFKAVAPSAPELGMLTDLTHYLVDDILVKVDRASMAVSLEARVPILDHRVVEFAWRLPLKFKLRRGTTKWALRQILHRYVPAELVERPKMGFAMPVDVWLRGPLRDWAEDLLSPENLARHGFLTVNPIREKWQEHLSGARDWQYLLWPVLMLQAWIAEVGRAVNRPAHDDAIVIRQNVTP